MASRMETSGEPGKIHISAAFANALDTDKWQMEASEVEVKGKGRMKTYFLDKN